MYRVGGGCYDLIIEHLTKRFESKIVLRDVTFAFEEG